MKIGLRNLLPVLLLMPGLAVAGEKVDFHYTNADVLAATDAAAAGAAWFDRCAKGGQFADIARGYGPDPRITREQRQAAEKGFDRAAFERIAQSSYDRVVKDLPQGKLSLCVDFASPDDTFARDQMQGVMAVTAGSGKIIVKLAPGADWTRLLPYVLAHELHHSYWAAQHFDPKAAFTLADYLVFEGRADNYAMHAFGAHPAPWTHALDKAQYEKTLAAFRPQLGDSSPQVLMGAMFGNPQAGIPLWAGYSVGYQMVAQRLSGMPKIDWAAVTAMPAADFIPADAQR